MPGRDDDGSLRQRTGNLNSLIQDSTEFKWQTSLKMVANLEAATWRQPLGILLIKEHTMISDFSTAIGANGHRVDGQDSRDQDHHVLEEKETGTNEENR